MTPQPGAPDEAVRAAGVEDVAALVAVINAAFRVERFFIERDRIDAATVRRMMSTGTFLIARGADRTPCACVYMERRGDRAYVGLLAVDPARQRRGLGAWMMARAEDQARAVGCRAVDIRVVNLREELPPFYRRLGYTEDGVAPFESESEPSRPCHFILMSKRLW